MKQNLTPRINRLEANLIIDGAMEIWPEGTSRAFASNSNGYGSVLMKFFNDNTGVTLTNSRQTSVPSNTYLNYSNQVSKTAAGTMAAGTVTGLFYGIEGYDLDRIMNNEFTIVFWVKSSVVSNRSLTVRNASSSHSFVRQYNISAINTWQLKAIKFPAMSTCPGTLDRTNGLGARIAWNIVTGSTFQTSTLNSWVTGSFISGIGEDTTWVTGTTHDFSIAGAMVLPGDWEALTASEYSFVRAGRNFQDELSASSRYFKKLAHVPITAQNTNLFTLYMPFDIVMRALPTLGITGGLQLNIQGTNSFNQTATPTFSPSFNTESSIGSTISGFTHALTNGHALFAAVPVNNNVYITADARF